VGSVQHNIIMSTYILADIVQYNACKTNQSVHKTTLPAV